MEQWNDGILVFKRMLINFIFSLIPLVVGALIQHYIIQEPIIPAFQHSSSFLPFWSQQPVQDNRRR